MFKLIDVQRISAVKKAIRGVFNTALIQQIFLLPGGYSSSKTYRIVIENKEFILRVMGLDQVLADRQQQIVCLTAAAKLGIAPQCYYGDAERGIVITEYIHNIPFENNLNVIDLLAHNLRQLHNIEDFPKAHQLTFDYLNDLKTTLNEFKLAHFLKNYLENLRHIENTLALYRTISSCHNDLNSNNILFNGQQFYFIDWEAAGAEDPFYDIGTICTQLVFNAEQEEYFLHRYFNQIPTVFQKAKLLLMKQVSLYYSALHFLIFAAQAGLSLENEDAMVDLPTLKEWTQGIKYQKYKLISPTDYLFYGMVLVKQSIHKMTTAEVSNAQKFLQCC